MTDQTVGQAPVGDEDALTLHMPRTRRLIGVFGEREATIRALCGYVRALMAHQARTGDTRDLGRILEAFGALLVPAAARTHSLDPRTRAAALEILQREIKDSRESNATASWITNLQEIETLVRALLEQALEPTRAPRVAARIR